LAARLMETKHVPPCAICAPCGEMDFPRRRAEIGRSLALGRGAAIT